MAGWFNIHYLSDPNFVKSVNSGSGYKAIGDALATLGGIYNAERDRQYKAEQDKLANERENKKLEFEGQKANSKVAYDLAGVDLRKAQGQKALSDMEQAILNGASLRGYRQGQLGLGAQRNAETARNNAFNNAIARERLDYEQDGGLVGIDPDELETLREAGVLNKANSMVINGQGFASKSGKNLTLKQRNAGTQYHNATIKTAPKADKPSNQGSLY